MPFHNGVVVRRGKIDDHWTAQTQSQNAARVIKFAQKGFHDENLFCPCDHCDTVVFVSARWCQYDLSDAAVPCVRRHQLYPNSGPMRGSGAILSPQVILAARKAAIIFLLSIARATQRPATNRRPLKPAGLSANDLNLENRKDTDMRASIAFPIILLASVPGSTLVAVAQTGEFPLQIPGSVMHSAWEIQDQLQNARSGVPVRSVNPPLRSYGWSNSAKPAPGGVTTVNGTKGER
jgi:hypothetical protein